MNPSPPGAIGEPASSRRHGMEPNGEFLLQLLQGGRLSSNGDGASSSSSAPPLDDFSHGIEGDGTSQWQHRDPAVAALGPSHSFHGSEHLPNQFLMAPQYGALPGGEGVWTSAQQHQQFYPPSHDPRGFGGARGPHHLQLGNPRFPPYPPPPATQLTDQAVWRSENGEFARRSDAADAAAAAAAAVAAVAAQGWLPPPHARDGSAAAGIPGPWSSGPILKTSPLPPPFPTPPPAPSQQFHGDGAELLQLLLGGGSQNLASKPARTGTNSKDLSGGVQVDNMAPRAQVVHGPIGPPKRNESSLLQPEPSEDLLGRFWQTGASSLANGAPEPSETGNKPAPEVQMRSSSLNAPSHPQQRPYGFSSEPSKSKVSKPPGFFAERDHSNAVPIDPNFVSSTAKALNHFSDFPAKGPHAWGKFQDGTTDVKQENTGSRASDDRGNYHIQQTLSRIVAAAKNREDAHRLPNPPKTRDDSTGLISADFLGLDILPLREPGRLGARGSGGRRGGGGGGGGGAGKAEMGVRAAAAAGRLSSGQWVAVNEKQKERDRERDLLGLEGAVSSAADVNTRPLAAKSTASGKDPESLNGKSKEEMKRRRGQIQEWRMKQASPPHSKSAEPGSRGHFHHDGNSEAILPLASQVDRPGLPSNTVRHSMPGSATDESKQQLQYQLDEGVNAGGRERAGRYLIENGRFIWEDGLGGEEEEDLMRELNFSGYTKLVEDAQNFSTTPPISQSVTPLAVLAREEAELEEKPGNLRDSREVRRHQQRMNFPTHQTKGDLQRLDFEAFNPQLLSIYKSLIPSQEEIQRQRKFLTQLDRLVSRDWGGAKLFLFGSCANDFGVCNSDIDVCLSVDDEQSSKAELVTRMAAILRSDDMQNVQALTHARVPIVKFTDPDTGINCDICVNNMLAVVNSKLLHDYSQVDPRLRQLAFLVKHWAKQRQVNETYRGTLSSYAYVLMCIHFLQQRRPAILPCLQSMKPTYEVTVGTIKCAYCDEVSSLKNFGARNKESVAELLTSFFDYWASCHDYNRWVISVRTGGYLSKDEKDWTRRIGNERHLICIEDPFEITHDLGRVVDRYSIRVLRDEFKRAARILRQVPNPATTLFEPFIREKV